MIINSCGIVVRKYIFIFSPVVCLAGECNSANSSFKNYAYQDDQARQTTDTPRFKPFTILVRCRFIYRVVFVYNGR